MAHVAVRATGRLWGLTDPGVDSLWRVFDLGTEANLPTCFSALLFPTVPGAFDVPFIRPLRWPLFVRLAVAVVVFLAGAVGIEGVENPMTGYGIPGIGVVRTLEESAEMAGLALAIRALLLELESSVSNFRSRFAVRGSP